MRRLATRSMMLVLVAGCSGVETPPEPGPEPIAAGPTREAPELGGPRPKLLPSEATAGAARE